LSKRANGEGTIYLRKDGRWAALLPLARGKRKQFLGKTRGEVVAKMTEAQADRLKGIPIVSNNQTVGQYLQAWLQSVKSSVRPRTYESYDLNVRRLTPLLGKKRLTSLTPAMIENAYADLAEGGLSKRSIVQAHTVLHNALKKAVKWGYLGRNPADAVDVPRPERTEMKTLTEEEVRLLFEATAGKDLHALWVLLASTGLRLGEALGLKWEDLDFNNSRLMVQRSLQQQKEGGLVLVEPKTSKSRRTVYFPSGTAEALRAHRRDQNARRLLVGGAWQDSGLVFCRENGAMIAPGTISHRLHTILKNAGLPQIRVHDLRHTAATLLLGKGENPKIVQELLGHSTIGITLDTYSHVTPAMHASAAAKMESLFTAV
jgi:integrase